MKPSGVVSRFATLWCGFAVGLAYSGHWIGAAFAGALSILWYCTAKAMRLEEQIADVLICHECLRGRDECACPASIRHEH